MGDETERPTPPTTRPITRDHEYVSSNGWSAHRPSSEVYRRAGGRRGYNKLRQIRATDRRIQIAHRIVAGGGFYRGLQSQLARELDVDRSTVSRDITAILNSGSAGLALFWNGDDP